MTVVILGITAVAVVGGLLTSAQFSDVHRKQATGGAYARDYTESISRHITGGGYKSCAGSPGQPDYSAALSSAPPSGFKAPIATYRYWDAAWMAGSSSSPWVATCPPSDAGLQQVTVTLESADGRATERSVIVVRKQ